MRRPGGQGIGLIVVQHVAHGQPEQVQIVLDAQQLEGVPAVSVDQIVLQLAQARNLAGDVGGIGDHGGQRDDQAQEQGGSGRPARSIASAARPEEYNGDGRTASRQARGARRAQALTAAWPDLPPRSWGNALNTTSRDFAEVFLSASLRVLLERPLEHVVAVIAHVFPLAALDRALELVPHSVHGLGAEGQLLPLELTLLEKLIEERALVAFPIAVTRNEAGHPSRVLQVDLHEFTIPQEGVHAGVIFRGLGGGALGAGACATKSELLSHNIAKSLPVGFILPRL